MMIRFTEFIQHDDKVINLYVVQETQESRELCFRIFIKDGEQAVPVLCKNEENTWKISPQEVPGWVDEIKPLMIHAIENRISTKDHITTQHVTNKRNKTF